MVFTETWKSQNSKATNNTAKCKPKHSNSKSRQKQKNKNVSKPPINVSKISILTKAAWFRPSKQNCKQVKAFSRPDNAPVYPLGTLDQNNCMLKTWSLDVKNAQNHHVKCSNSNTSKRRKNKKRGQLKRQKMLTKKSHWKCTHRAGVKCCNKNVIWLKIQYGGASRNAVPFL